MFCCEHVDLFAHATWISSLFIYCCSKSRFCVPDVPWYVDLMFSRTCTQQVLCFGICNHCSKLYDLNHLWRQKPRKKPKGNSTAKLYQKPKIVVFTSEVTDCPIRKRRTDWQWESARSSTINSNGKQSLQSNSNFHCKKIRHEQTSASINI